LGILRPPPPANHFTRTSGLEFERKRPPTATIARQLSEVQAPRLDAYRDGRQRWRHIAIIRERYGFRDLEEDAAAGFRLTRWLSVLCWTEDDRPGLLFGVASHGWWKFEGGVISSFAT
jgi:Domain of unknown function (DUF4158)